MVDFQRSSYENTEALNKVIACVGSTLQTEKEALSCVRSEIQREYSELNTYGIDKLQKDLSTENNLMNKPTQKTGKVKVLSVNLNYANKHLDDLESEKTVLKSCVSDVNQYL